MKTKRNNPYPDETGSAALVGEPGAGKTAFSSELIFALSDVTQLKRVDEAMSPDERDKFVRTIEANTLFRMNLEK